MLVAVAYFDDIGYAPELAQRGFHPLDCALWLQGQGLDRRAGVVAHHTAARFEAETHRLVFELAVFVDERSPVTDALTYSDLTTGTAGERLSDWRERASLRSREFRRSRLGLRLMRSQEMVSRTEQLLASASASWERTQP